MMGRSFAAGASFAGALGLALGFGPGSPRAGAQTVPPAPASSPAAPEGSPPQPAASQAAENAPPAPSAPTAAPTPLYAFVYRAPPQPIPPTDVPAIAEIDLNATALTPPAPLHVRVLTSVAVVSVTAQTSLSFMSRGIAIPKAQPGLFLFDGYIPDVPFFLRNHTFNVDFVATAANGKSVDISLPLRLN
jgi:hypothetical protein